MGKLIFTLLISYLFISNFLYVDLKEECLIFVKPYITPSNWNAREIIQVVKNNDRESYNLMCENINFLSKDIPLGCPYIDGGCYKPDTRNTIYVGNDMDNLALTSAILVHEICHLEQNLEKRPLDEPECYSKDSEFLKQIQIF
jgi:hypothetical protein